MSEKIKPEQNLDEIRKQVFDKIKTWKFTVDLLENIPAVLHKEFIFKIIETAGAGWVSDHLDKFSGLDAEVALVLIDNNYPEAVVEHLNLFSGLNEKVALELINAGYGLEVMNNMDYFDGIDENIIALAMLMAGQGGFVRLNPELFPGLTEETLAKINDRNYQPTKEDREIVFGKDVELNAGLICLVTGEAKGIRKEMVKQLAYWKEFYKQYGEGLSKLPEKIFLTTDDKETLAKGAKALCPDGNFEKLKMLIIPADLANNGENYSKLLNKMSQNYTETYQMFSFTKDGGFATLQNKSDKMRIILVKDVQNLADDQLYKSTLNESVDELELDGGIFKQTGLKGIDIAVYLVWQKEYFARTGNHLDTAGWTWLTEHKRPSSCFVYTSSWDPERNRLRFGADPPSTYVNSLGCRLACTIEK